MYMKIYLKPYTACTKVELEGLLVIDSKNKGGHSNPIYPSCPPNNSSIDQSQVKGGWNSVKVGTPSHAAKDDYFTNFED